MKKIKKIKACLSFKKGSVLAYSLIILSLMLMIAVGISSVAIVEKKSATTTTASVQALQTADSGADMARKAISANPGVTLADLATNNLGGSCSNVDGVAKITVTNFAGLSPSEPAVSRFELTFFDKVEPVAGQLTACTDLVANIGSVKSVGIYKGTFRAVQMSVDATTLVSNYGYLICKDPGGSVQPFNVEDPLNPVLFTAQGLGGNLGNGVISNGYLYIIEKGLKKLKTVDIHTDPTTLPIPGGGPSTGDTPTTPIVIGNYLYLQNGDKTLQTFDISSGVNPTLKSSVTNVQLGSSVGMDSINRKVFIFDYVNESMHTFNTEANPATPSFVGSLGLTDTGSIYPSASSNGYLYVGAPSTRNILTYKDEVNSPSLKNTLATAARPKKMLSSGQYLYVFDDNKKIQTYDIQNDPSRPSFVKTTSLISEPLAVEFFNGYIYITYSSKNMEIFDVTADPKNPSSVKTVPTTYEAVDIVFSK